jgi:hypothetical protein
MIKKIDNSLNRYLAFGVSDESDQAAILVVG